MAGPVEASLFDSKVTIERMTLSFLGTEEKRHLRVTSTLRNPSGSRRARGTRPAETEDSGFFLQADIYSAIMGKSSFVNKLEPDAKASGFSFFLHPVFLIFL